MVRYLSQEWLDAQAALAGPAGRLPERPAVSARAVCTVTGAPGGDVTYRSTVTDGRVSATALGAAGDVGDVGDVSLTVGYETATRISKGDLDANTAYMLGDLKVVGHVGKLMALLALSQTPECRAVRADLAAQTEW